MLTTLLTALFNLVNPFVGTDFTGNTYPGAQVPFGMVQLSPDNGVAGWNYISGYYYPSNTIAGFSHTHLDGTGAGDLYDISFLPITLPARDGGGELGIHSRFSHSSEQAHAGYYSVMLSDYNIRVELTATQRCGIQRYTFPEAQGQILLNLKKAMNWDMTEDSHVEVVDGQTIRGYRFSNGWARHQKVYFCTRFSRPWDSLSISRDSIQQTGGMAVVARFSYKTTGGEQITVSTAISGVSMEGAMLNLEKEAPNDDFDAARRAAEQQWESRLRAIEITPTDDDEASSRVFYTAMYHSMLAPTIFSDVDGRYRGPDGDIHEAEGWTNMSTFSLWDTFRASHPLFTLTAPDRVKDMVSSLLAFSLQNGRTPVWPMWASETDMMIGYHAVPVMVDAYLKDPGSYDADELLSVCIATANLDDYRGIGLYKRLGYVPYDVPDPYNSDDWSLSRTLEYAYDDYCIARLAEKMGREDIMQEFDKRSQNYRNVFNPATGFMQPRDSKGQFQPSFTPDAYTPHICESNGWQYLWSVQHDVKGLMSLLGGRKRFASRLDSMFTYTPGDTSSLPIFSTGMIGQYVHGNEPSHHVIYLFNAAGEPWKTQRYVHQVMRAFYRDVPDGLCGNEDCGQMSAWLVFSAMGFYPVDPVSGRYEIGSPMFKEVKFHLQNGLTFTVRAHNASRENIYIKSVSINGRPLKTSFITHEQILSGATLDLEMSPRPQRAWYKTAR